MTRGRSYRGKGLDKCSVEAVPRVTKNRSVQHMAA